MLDVRRGGRYLNNLKKQFKTFAFWKKYTPFVDKNALPEKGPTISGMETPLPPHIGSTPGKVLF